jgi:hypothetical protein
MSAAPGGFDTITQALVRRFKSLGLHGIVGYIDDFWFTAETEEECRRGYEIIIEVLREMGFTVNLDKCVPPTRTLTFLGIELTGAYSPSPLNHGALCAL